MPRSSWSCLMLCACAASSPPHPAEAPAPAVAEPEPLGAVVTVPEVEPSAPEVPVEETAVEALLAEADDEGEEPPDDDPMRVTDSGLGITDLRYGTGPRVVAGDEVEVHYVGRLGDGTVFDESRPRRKPFVFEVGSGRVIAGWDEGLVGMQRGGLRRLLIPPHLAYGRRGAPPKVPPDAILEFEIELLAIR